MKRTTETITFSLPPAMAAQVRAVMRRPGLDALGGSGGSAAGYRVGRLKSGGQSRGSNLSRTQKGRIQGRPGGAAASPDGSACRGLFGKDRAMPRQRIRRSRDPREFPDDFPERLKRFEEESRLSWSEIARRLGTYRNIVWRWKEGLAPPNNQHRKALFVLADSMGLGHLFTE